MPVYCRRELSLSKGAGYEPDIMTPISRQLDLFRQVQKTIKACKDFSRESQLLEKELVSKNRVQLINNKGAWVVYNPDPSHKLGTNWTIHNTAFGEQFRTLVRGLNYRPQMSEA